MTVVRPCSIFETCPPDSPIDNFSSETDDPVDYLAYGYGSGSPPPLLHDWSKNGCNQVFISTISQEDADRQAQAAADACIIDNHGDNKFFNKAQTCTVTCPDRSSFSYTVPAGVFPGVNQATADALAMAWACKMAPQKMICISSLPNSICVNTKANFLMTATGPSVTTGGNLWSVVGGSLPLGMSISNTTKSTALISGVPHIPGLYSFTLGFQNSTHGSTVKLFFLCVTDISSGLPNGTVGTAYSGGFSTGCSAATFYKVSSGSLPPGLSLNPITGAVTGTPTTAGTYPFTIQATVI